MKDHKSTEKWGKDTASARYGKTDKSLNNNPKANDLQAPQDIQDQHMPGYDNDSKGWVRGMPSAESKPGFDHSKKG